MKEMDTTSDNHVPPDSDSDCNTDTEEFFFESDHLAFRGNADYTSVLRTIAILQTQKIQAANDIEKLAKAEKSAFENPEEFVKKLGRGEVNELPGPITIAEVRFDLNQCNGSMDEFIFGFRNYSSSYQKLILRSMVFLFLNLLRNHNRTLRTILPFVEEYSIKRSRKRLTRYDE